MSGREHRSETARATRGANSLLVVQIVCTFILQTSFLELYAGLDAALRTGIHLTLAQSIIEPSVGCALTSPAGLMGEDYEMREDFSLSL